MEQVHSPILGDAKAATGNSSDAEQRRASPTTPEVGTVIFSRYIHDLTAKWILAGYPPGEALTQALKEACLQSGGKPKQAKFVGGRRVR